jgi:hypothetical protein
VPEYSLPLPYSAGLTMLLTLLVMMAITDTLDRSTAKRTN